MVRLFGLIVWKLYVILFGWTRVGKRRSRVVITDGKAVLLIKNLFGSQKWMLPGGGFKKDEAPEDCASREIEEELGVTINPKKFTFHYDQDVRTPGLVPFKAAVLTLKVSKRPKLTLQKSEILDAQWFDLDKLPEDLNKFTADSIRKTLK